jgi:cysteinyl-tRNA synthetase
MSKHIEKLKKQLIEISEVVNSFKSEAVQVKIIDKLFDAMIEFDRNEVDGNEPFTKKGRKQRSDYDTDNYPFSAGRKKPGATKILNQLLSTEFFNAPQSISSIADYCKDTYNSDFKTSELSGILLKLAKEHKLKRERNNDNNRFEYARA